MGTRQKVKQLDYYTGELIHVYNSISEAADDNWMGRANFYKIINKQNGYMARRKLRFEFVDSQKK